MKLKHSKYKNTGILFELLTRQLTSDTIAGNRPKSLSILKKYFNKKSWVEWLLVSEAKKYNKPTIISGVPASQREIGTDALLKYAKSMVPGQDWGKQFINKYRKK